MNKDIFDLSDELYDKISILSIAVYGASEFMRNETGESLGYSEGLTIAFRELETAVNTFKEKALNKIKSEKKNDSN